MLTPVVHCVEKERVAVYALQGRDPRVCGARAEISEEDIAEAGLGYFDVGFGALKVEVWEAVGGFVRDEIFTDGVVGEDDVGVLACS